MPNQNQYWISEHQKIPTENEKEYTCVVFVSEEMSMRDSARALLLLSSGYRQTELLDLQMQDVHIEKWTVKVRGESKWVN